MDVDGAARVPARVDALEEGQALRIGALDAPQEREADGVVGLLARVLATGARVPDIDRGALDRLARRRVDTLKRSASGAPAGLR